MPPHMFVWAPPRGCAYSRNIAPAFDSPTNSALALFYPAHNILTMFVIVCGMGESNPQLQFGKLSFYH